jgi:hypothetical protein
MYIYSSNHVIICLSFHMHHHDKNIFKHVLFDLHDIQIMEEDIIIPMRKLPKKYFA